MIETLLINFISRYQEATEYLIALDPATIEIVSFLVGFLVGVLGGYAFGIGIRDATEGQMQNGIAMLITLAWILSILVDAIEPAYQTPIGVHAMMGAVAGYLFQLEGGLPIHLGGRK
jgi:hypothetical protein